MYFFYIYLPFWRVGRWQGKFKLWKITTTTYCLCRFLSEMLALQSVKLVNLSHKYCFLWTFCPCRVYRIMSYLAKFNNLSSFRNSFKRLSNQPKLSLLREGLKIFLRHFLLPHKTSDAKMGNSRMLELIDKCEAAIDGREYVPL